MNKDLRDFKVNLNTVWKVVEKDLPELEDQVHALLDELDIEVKK